MIKRICVKEIVKQINNTAAVALKILSDGPKYHSRQHLYKTLLTPTKNNLWTSRARTQAMAETVKDIGIVHRKVPVHI